MSSPILTTLTDMSFYLTLHFAVPFFGTEL
jgi:hypothetical protein